MKKNIIPLLLILGFMSYAQDKTSANQKKSRESKNTILVSENPSYIMKSTQNFEKTKNQELKLASEFAEDKTSSLKKNSPQLSPDQKMLLPSNSNLEKNLPKKL